MKHWKLGATAAVAACCLATALWMGKPDSQADVERLVTPLPKLTTAVLAEVRDPLSGKPPPDDQILRSAMRENPELKNLFQNVVIRLRHNCTNAILLVCSPDGKRAWLEDASWTQFVDRKHYLTNPPGPPAFTINLP